VLALLSVLLLAATFVVGLWVGDFNAAARQKRSAQARVVELGRQQRASHTQMSSDLDQAKDDLKAADVALATPRSRMTLHMLLGSAAALMAVLVNSIAITYFIGTSRWCREVCQTYEIRGELSEMSANLKRGVYPWALAGIGSIILIVGLGAAADPSGANFARSASFVMPHYLAAMIGLVVVIATFGAQVGRIADNHRVIAEILREVQRIRAAKKLPMEESSAL
jgi:hypothetical protein